VRGGLATVFLSAGLLVGCGPAGGDGGLIGGGDDDPPGIDASEGTTDGGATPDGVLYADANLVDADPNAPDAGKGPQCGSLRATIRDFNRSGTTMGHSDFETAWGSEPSTNLVETTLDADRKPIFGTSPTIPTGSRSPQIASANSFRQWYHDDPINQVVEVDLPLTLEPSGRLVFDDQTFFPIDGMGLNQQTEGFDRDGVSVGVHNYHFTTEIHTQFIYKTGDQFTFSGDDDLWLFINGQRVIDLGGLHSRLTRTVNLDSLNLTDGNMYPMDIFHAERRTEASTFRIETSIDCFVPPVDE
jgi:fibro-slime domain-containing protein